MEPEYNSKLYKMLERYDILLGYTILWLRTFQEIGFNAVLLNNYGSAFGGYQKSVLHSLTNDIFSIFDKHDHYETVSIASILKQLKTEEEQLLSPKRFARRLREDFEITLAPEMERFKERAIQKLECQRPTFANDIDLENIEAVRNNYTAHLNLDLAMESPKFYLPTDYAFLRLLHWAHDFRRAVYWGYFPNCSAQNMFEWAEVQIHDLKKLIKLIVGEDNYKDPMKYLAESETTQSKKAPY